MPLIIVTGYPSSGKTSLSIQISEFFQLKLKQEGDSRTIKIVSDSDSLEWDGRDSIYMSIPKEKELRGWLKSEIQRHLSLNQIVILDAAVYIKGLRYEIYCIAKEAKTQYCIVEILIDKDTCWRWNECIRSASGDKVNPDEPTPGYSKDTFEALMFRYERCDETNRWDSPLLRMTNVDDKISFDELYNIIIRQDPLAPNKCTSLSSTTTTIYKPKK